MEENPYRAPVEKGAELAAAAAKRIWRIAVLLVQVLCVAFTIALSVRRASAPLGTDLEDVWLFAIAVQVGIIVAMVWAHSRQRT